MNSSNRKTISCFVAVKNNPDITKLSLDTMDWIDEIILIDSSTNQDILELSKNYKNLIYYHTYEDNIKKKALTFCPLSTCDYILLASFDEFFSKDFASDILDKLANEDFDAIECHPHDFNFGIDCGPNRSHFHNKIVKKEDVVFLNPDTLHETIKTDGKILRCEIPYTHISNSLLLIYILKNYKYEMISLRDFTPSQLVKYSYYNLDNSQLFRRTLKDWVKFNYHFFKNILHIRKTGHKSFYSAYCNLMVQIIKIISPTEESFIRAGKVDRNDTRGYL